MHIRPLDLSFCGMPEIIASYLVQGVGSPLLIESGPGSTLENLRRQLEGEGLSFADISDVFVTHIHLDHSGGAWAFAEAGATIHVPKLGGRHLVDPSRLVDSARMVYKERFDELWGDVRGIAEAQVNMLEDEQRVVTGGIEFHCWDSCGHAKHHQVFGCGDTAFVGDVVGCRLPGEEFISLTSAPPQFDPEAWVATLDKLDSQRYYRIYPTHFGPIDDVKDHIVRFREVMHTSSQFVRDLVDSGMDDDKIRNSYLEFTRDRAASDGVSDDAWLRYECVNPCDMCADGIALYWRKKLE